ncbi:MAG: ribonuclease P protein component [Succinivibrionaceae bacterium]|nr:ribonuclease P protein component [Succinivibrionaceae bacterium]
MSDNAFPRTSRLLSSRDYDKVFKKPVRASVREMLILGCPNGGTGPRLGLVVPKKVLKRAVDRNLVKRLVRESFRNSRHTLPSADLVFIAKQHIGERSRRDLRLALERLWEQISTRLNPLPLA